MDTKTLGIVAVVVLVLGLGAWMITSGSRTTNETTIDVDMIPNPTNGQETTGGAATTTTTTTTSTTTSSASAGVNVGVGTGTTSVKSFTVSGSNFAFAPTTMNVQKGDTVRIIFKNVEGTHDLKIDELNVNTGVLQGPGEKTVEFVASKTGSFEYYCSVGNHRQMGMKGVLTVQ